MGVAANCPQPPISRLEHAVGSSSAQSGGDPAYNRVYTHWKLYALRFALI